MKEATFKKQALLLKRLRKKKGLSQGMFASALGLKNQYISNIEREICGISPRVAKALIKHGVAKAKIVATYKADVGAMYASKF